MQQVAFRSLLPFFTVFVLLFEKNAAIRDPSIGDGGALAPPDVFEDEFSHFHVSASTHRMSLPQHRAQEPPTLAVTFSLRPVATTLQLTLPPGYQIRAAPADLDLQGSNCKLAFAPSSLDHMSSYANETEASPMVEHISSCVVSTEGYEGHQRIKLLLKLRPGVPGLSAPLADVNRSAAEGVGPLQSKWWFFHILSWLPDATPDPSTNFFQFHWSTDNDTQWEGDTRFSGWPVLGDWDCIYSDWEGWGSCSARCGGGTQTLTRRVLLQPPSGEKCTDVSLKDPQPCNDHPCIFSCEFEEIEDEGNCSAACGGGVRVFRQRWKGENCPRSSDLDAVRLEPCNTQPCVAPCKISDTWSVVTECSALCGKGYFWIMKEVLQKDPNDIACQPVWRELPCVKQECAPLSIMRPDPIILPFPKDKFTVGISFTLSADAQRIELSAPDSEAYSFGEPGSACKLKDHSLMPYFKSCEVGELDNKVVLHMHSPLPRSNSVEDRDRYEFQIEVMNPECRDDDWDPDPLRASMVCNVGPYRSRWRLDFTTESGSFESLWGEGYQLFWPGHEAGRGDIFSDSDDKTSEAAAAKQRQGHHEAKSKTKAHPDFCSPRVPCQDGLHCTRPSGSDVPSLCTPIA
eukprot:TRINITY_DN50455_c0_g1_i1.p1 TRINITY_DN50455_c0_g1~~TRINITY_DN50455_c0_g1_i1.p1  ORF type:complete len:628 (+),score=105.01 TRINITY_DN50455_c0_g1_i1:143-2026(+)